MEVRPNVFCPSCSGLFGVKGEGMMELEPSEPLLEAFGEEEEEDDEEMVRILVTSACHMTPHVVLQGSEFSDEEDEGDSEVEGMEDGEGGEEQDASHVTGQNVDGVTVVLEKKAVSQESSCPESVSD